MLRFRITVSWCYRQLLKSALDCQWVSYIATFLLIVVFLTAIGIIN